VTPVTGVVATTPAKRIEGCLSMRAPHVPHLVSLVPHAAADNIRVFTQQTRSTVPPDECIAAPDALPDPGRGNRTGTTRREHRSPPVTRSLTLPKR